MATYISSVQFNVLWSKDKFKSTESFWLFVFSCRTLTQSNTELEDRCSKLLGERPSPTGAAGDGEIEAEEKDVSAEDDPVEEGMILCGLLNAYGSYFKVQWPSCTHELTRPLKFKKKKTNQNQNNAW